ncbi:class I SAM-dependent methyltransferase [Mycolicibacterium hodleri]|uniref:class I SAM-dependent methyltransferase n=1 Tax=Mycolicibacterium hodleri TaxID=49897 RepID=UPI0021F2870C|nr:class I SAM-dependent methyltransferase [Mycolicibacterium hodleri]
MTGPDDDTVIAVYQRYGSVWAKLRDEHLVERSWLDRFCDVLPVGGTVLDIGCGSGIPIARELIRRGVNVTGFDGSSTMLALFERNVPATPVHLGDMRELSLGRRFDGLLAWDSLFHLSPSDQRAMFPRFAAHAAPGAALMFTSGNSEGAAIGHLDGVPLYHGSLDPDGYLESLDANGFDVVDHVSKDPSCGSRTVWLARRRG